MCTVAFVLVAFVSGSHPAWSPTVSQTRISGWVRWGSGSGSGSGSGLGSQFSRRTSGQCSYPITTLAQCERAAGVLGFDDIAAIEQRHGQGAFDDPRGCYYGGYALRFNSGGNYGPCTPYDECLCGPPPATGTCVVSECREGVEQYCGVYESYSDHTWRQECGTGNNIIHIAPYDRNYWTIANSTNGYTETEWGWGENSVLSWYGSSMESPDRSNTTFGYMFIEIDCVPGAPLPASDIPTRCGGCSAITTPTMCFSAGSGCVWDISAGSGSSDEDTDDLGTGVRAACYFTIRAALKHRALTLCALVEVEVERVLHS